MANPLKDKQYQNARPYQYSKSGITRNFCRIFVPKFVRNGKKVGSVRLGDEADAPPQSQFRHFEGFLSELLGDAVTIKQILDSERNKETNDDKHNRVDILVENSKDELVIIEVQNSKEYDYFHRMLYGTSKAISEHIKEGQAYAEVKKIISITIAYFDLGQGKDYVYHGTTVFRGVHKNDILTLSGKQVELYKKDNIQEVYPEYWVIKVSQFHNRVKDKLDEWIYFFKNAGIKSSFSAKGLKEAGEKLDQMKLNEKDAKAYKKYLKNLRDIASEQHTIMADAQDLINKGKAEERIETVLRLHKKVKSTEDIADLLDLGIEEITQIIENQRNK
jgi:predicted transposase/invertase (TIGR01784 family)